MYSDKIYNDKSNSPPTEYQPVIRNYWMDGCLFFPQYNLFIDSPNNNTSFLDIHGLGRETGAFDGVWHCVPSLKTVLLAEEKNATPQPMSSPSNKYSKQQLFAVVDGLVLIGYVIFIFSKIRWT